MLLLIILAIIVLFILSLNVPFMILLLIFSIFVLVILQYQKSRKIHQELQEIRRHLGLMNSNEQENFDLEHEISRLDKLDEAELEKINEQIEEELEKTNITKHNPDNK